MGYSYRYLQTIFRSKCDLEKLNVPAGMFIYCLGLLLYKFPECVIVSYYHGFVVDKFKTSSSLQVY